MIDCFCPNASQGGSKLAALESKAQAMRVPHCMNCMQIKGLPRGVYDVGFNYVVCIYDWSMIFV